MLKLPAGMVLGDGIEITYNNGDSRLGYYKDLLYDEEGKQTALETVSVMPNGWAKKRRGSNEVRVDKLSDIVSVKRTAVIEPESQEQVPEPYRPIAQAHHD